MGTNLTDWSTESDVLAHAPGAFPLVGDVDSALVERVSAGRITDGDLAMVTLEDAIVLPGTWDGCREDLIAWRRTDDPRSSARPGFPGGVVDSEGNPVPTGNLHRSNGQHAGGLLQKHPSLRRCEHDPGCVVYLGWAFAHFGHFLLESMSRLWALDSLSQSWPVIFYRPLNGLPAAHLRALELAGVQQQRIRSLDGPCSFRQVVVPSAAYELGHQVHRRFGQTCRRRSTQVSRVSSRAGTLYLSRGRLGAGHRHVVGERALELLLGRGGVTVVHPERISLDEQLTLLAQHDDVIAPVGSAAHLVLFTGADTRWHVLSQAEVSVDYALAPGAVNSLCVFYHALDTGGLPSYGTSCHLRLDIARTQHMLAQVGLLRSPQQINARVQHDIDVAYRELWHYGAVRLELKKTLAGEPHAVDAKWLAGAQELAQGSWPIAFLCHCLERVRGADSGAMYRCYEQRLEAEHDLSRRAFFAADHRVWATALSLSPTQGSRQRR